MHLEIPLDTLTRFVLAALIGMLIGLERSMKASRQPHAGIRDFVLFALTGSLCAIASVHFDTPWIIVAGLLGVSAFLLSGYWAELQGPEGSDERGITTELTGLLTFLLGVSMVAVGIELTIALTVIVLVVLSQKALIGRFQQNVQRFELDAVLKLLVITFIVLPFLPRVTLDHYLTLPLGSVSAIETDARIVEIRPADGRVYPVGSGLTVYARHEVSPGTAEILSSEPNALRVRIDGIDESGLVPESVLYQAINVEWLRVMASAVSPLRVWIIVILVSFIGFIGYVLVKVLGSTAGIGLTGLVGGLASSTATALSFARRSLETPALNRQFAVAVILASTVMFPRLLLQIGVVNPLLMQRVAFPLLMMALSGGILAAVYFQYSRRNDVVSRPLQLDNPFSLASAMKFGAVFATVLVITQLAISYLGDAWLPVVSVISGLTDADAIAFSLSAAQRSGQISTDWAAFNLVLGAISNTFTKLILIFVLGDRGLFRQVLIAFLIISGVGLITALLYYDVVTFGP